jgi:hypothetical protein
MPAKLLLNVGDLAVRLGALEYHVRQACERGLIPYARAGRNRVFDEADVPTIRAAMVAAGFLPAPAAEPARA